MKKHFLHILILLISINTYSQNGNDWPHIPGFNPTLHTTLTNQSTLIGVIGLAAISYSLEELVLKNHENINFYSTKAGMNNEHAFGLRNLWHQNFGVEQRVANWFSVSAEFNMQQWYDQTLLIENNQRFGIGFGIMTYYRWYLLGQKRFSPFIEYGTGIFMGIKKFPYNGTSFTFNNSTQLGIEYSISDQSKIRLSYGNFNQTNYNLFRSNPSYNGNGFSIGCSLKMK